VPPVEPCEEYRGSLLPSSERGSVLVAGEAAGCVVPPVELCAEYRGSFLSSSDRGTVAGTVDRVLPPAESVPSADGVGTRFLPPVVLCVKESKKFRILFFNLESNSGGTVTVTVP
jgi:hypothetical protein